MPVRPVEQAREVIGPYSEKIVALVHGGFAEYLDGCRPVHHMLADRTRASGIRDCIIFRARSWADKTGGVQFFERGQLCWIGFKNNWIVRVKLVDENFAVGVSPTGASRDFDCNKEPKSVRQALLDDQPATLLYLGWRTTENAPLKPDVSLVCNNEHAETAWIWTLEGAPPPPRLKLPDPVAPDGGADDGARRLRVVANNKAGTAA